MILSFMVLLAARSSNASPTPELSSEYLITVDQNTVEICSAHRYMVDWVRDCPDKDGMLRQDVETKELVRLAETCRQTTSTATDIHSAATCYVDECVAPGTYRYGLANPYACNGSISTRVLYKETHVGSPLGNCQRKLGSSAPRPYGGNPPWADAPSDTCDNWPGDTGCITHACSLSAASEEEANPWGMLALFAALGLVMTFCRLRSK